VHVRVCVRACVCVCVRARHLAAPFFDGLGVQHRERVVAPLQVPLVYQLVAAEAVLDRAAAAAAIAYALVALPRRVLLVAV
jgi:hypothetical protein